jgi:hypothetical protein
MTQLLFAWMASSKSALIKNSRNVLPMFVLTEEMMKSVEE